MCILTLRSTRHVEGSGYRSVARLEGSSPSVVTDHTDQTHTDHTH